LEIKVRLAVADYFGVKVMPLRYAGTCSKCESALSPKTRAWWDALAKQVTCAVCLPIENSRSPLDGPERAPTSTITDGTTVKAPATSFAPPAVIDHGTGGISAAHEYKRRHAKHERQIEAKWGTGRIGRIVKFLSDEPQTTMAWAKGAEGERRLARRLNDELADVAVVLHDRKVPNTRGNIDHLVVAPSGIWIIDAKNYKGKVERRDLGGLFATNIQLFVGGRNQTKLVTGLDWQVAAVRAALDPIGFAEAPVHTAVCFTDSEWPMFAKPLQIGGVTVTWPAKLIEAVRTTGPLDTTTIDTLARHLSATLPASA